MKIGVSFMGNTYGGAGSKPGTVIRVRAAWGVREKPILEQWAQVMSHFPGPTMNKQQSSQHKLRRRIQWTDNNRAKKPNRNSSQGMLPQPAASMNW